MKLAKKVIAGVLSLAVMVGACFVFSGCSGVKGNEYKYKTLYFTIITELEDASNVGTDKAIIKTTRTLSAREYYILKNEPGATLDNLAKTTTDAKDEEIMKWCEETAANAESRMRNALDYAKRTNYNFKSKKVEMITSHDVDKVIGSTRKDIMICSYTNDDGVIEIINTKVNPNDENDREEYYEYMYLVGERLEQRFNIMTEPTEYVVGGLCLLTFVYGEV